jgi:murein DD-endopeptidase MepM/ murein hydrolase activator NlpD
MTRCALTAAIFLSLTSLSADSISQDWPKGYFRYPLGNLPKLNANFGEMRPNHFHMGLDMSTDKRENLPLFAAADGYVSRFKIEPGGFGRAVYISHPNGLSTLYAHMNDFMPELEAHVKRLQYEKESWAMDAELPPSAFPVKKGQFIGYSGNTGGSQGPHLHFEVRESSTDKCINPLLLGFDIPDRVPPDLIRLAVYDRTRSTYEQSPSLYSLSLKGGVYAPPGVIRVTTDKVSLALQATDRMSGTPNPNGIYLVRVLEGEKPIGGFSLDKVGYEETRYLNAHIDHRHKKAGGPYLQHLFRLPGDRLAIYLDSLSDGIRLPDSATRTFRIEVSDPYGNTSVARLSLQRTFPAKTPTPREGPLMRPGELGLYEAEDIQVVVPEDALYDDISFRHVRSSVPQGPSSYSPVHELHTPSVPLHVPMTVRVKADKPIPYPLRDRMLIRRTTGEEQQVQKARWELGWHTASFREFGRFQLISDELPPTIQFVGLTEGARVAGPKIVVTVDDENKAVKNFRAELDGKWLMFAQKGKTFTYRMDERFTPGKHSLQVSVEDEAGNRSTRTIELTR